MSFQELIRQHLHSQIDEISLMISLLMRLPHFQEPIKDISQAPPLSDAEVTVEKDKCNLHLLVLSIVPYTLLLYFSKVNINQNSEKAKNTAELSRLEVLLILYYEFAQKAFPKTGPVGILKESDGGKGEIAAKKLTKHWNKERKEENESMKGSSFSENINKIVECLVTAVFQSFVHFENQFTGNDLLVFISKVGETRNISPPLEEKRDKYGKMYHYPPTIDTSMINEAVDQVFDAIPIMLEAQLIWEGIWCV